MKSTGILNSMDSKRAPLQSTLYLKVISDFTQSLLYVNTEDEIIWTIATKAVGKLDLEDCVVYVVDHATNCCIQRAAHGPKRINKKQIVNSIDIPIGSGIVGTVALTGQPEIVPDTSKDKRYIPDDKVRLSEIAVPIIIDGDVIAVIDSENSLKNFYNAEHLSILTTIASIAATKLSQARALKEFQKANQELERIVKENTDVLKKSNEELKQYAYTVSHDLKAPMRIIAGHVEILKKRLLDNTDATVKEVMHIIQENANSMNQLIEGVLEHSISQKQYDDFEQVDTNDVVNEMLHRFDAASHIQFDIPKILPTIKAKRVMIMQVFQNLISNAIRYNNKEKGIVEIKSEELNDVWLFSVKDNGIGIAKSDHESVFQLFTKAKNNKRVDATGIGLATVKKIIESYKGKIWLSSELHKGTCFYFTLPKRIA